MEFYNGDRSSRYPSDSDMVSDGIPFINAGDLVSGRVKLDTANRITKEKFNHIINQQNKRKDNAISNIILTINSYKVLLFSRLYAHLHAN